MPQQTEQVGLTQQQQLALTAVYGRAATMVRTLAARRSGWTNRIPQVRAFQEEWNLHLPELREWVGFGATGNIAEVLSIGLKEDGRYGVFTATALGELIYLISEDYDNAANSVPISAANVPVWYAQYHSLIEGALTTNFSQLPFPQDQDVSINADAMTQEVIDDARSNQGPIPQDSGSVDITFDEPSTITSTARRTGWNVPVWAVGLGLVTAGTLLFFVARKTRRRGSARV